MPRFSVEAASDAAENGRVSGRFVVRRAGSAEAAVTVGLALSGSATAGTDYEAVASTLRFAPNVREMMVEIRPYVDSLDESSETVRLEVLGGAGYVLAGTFAAELVIADLEPLVNLEVVRSDVSFSPASPAVILLHRDGLIDRQIVVQLSWAGSAARARVGSLPEFVELGRGETRRVIEIAAAAGVSAPIEPLVLTARVVPHDSYLPGDASSARLSVVPSTSEFGDWLAAHGHEGVAGDPEGAATSDPGGHDVPLITRFAFGLDPDHPSKAATSLPRVVFRNGKPGVEFVVRPGVAGVDVTVETSLDLNAWARGAEVLRETSGAFGSEFPAGWRRFEASDEVRDPRRSFRVRLGLR